LYKHKTYDYECHYVFHCTSALLHVVLFIFRPSNGKPLTSNDPKLVISLVVPEDEPIAKVSLPTRDNVDKFRVTVIRPNGDDVPVDSGRVSCFTISSGTPTHK